MKLNVLKPAGIALCSLFTLFSCVKDDDYEIPDPNGKRPLPSFAGKVVSFGDVAAKATASVTTYTADEAIEGYVISSDEGGNIYKKIYIQSEDKKNAVVVAINKTGLYSDFPLGSKVQLRLKDLSIHQANGGVEFGSGTYKDQGVGQMAEAIYKNHLYDMGGTRKSLADLAKADSSIDVLKVDANVNQLVTLKGVHFKTADVGKELHLTKNDKQQGTDYTLTDAQGKTIPFRTSRYAKFIKEKVPAGTLDITGILTKYRTSWQFVVNSYADIKVVSGTVTQTQTGTTTNTTVETLEAKNATLSDYLEGKTVKLHGTTVVKSGKTYIIFKDGTEIQLYAAQGVTISNEAKEKLGTEGYEIRIKGVFKDFKPKNGAVVRELIYSQESDIEFIKAPAPITYVDLDATAAAGNDYQVGKYVNLKNATLKMENNKAYVVFSDNTKVQLYSPNLNSFKAENRDKLATNGQVITSIKGRFEDYTKDGVTTKQLVYNTEKDVVFGTTPTTPSTPTIVELDATTATVADFEANKGKTVKLTGILKDISKKSHIVLSDNTAIQLYVKNYNSLPMPFRERMKEGTKVTVTGTFGVYQKTKQITYQKSTDVDFK